jgi:hypothetical protein
MDGKITLNTEKKPNGAPIPYIAGKTFLLLQHFTVFVKVGGNCCIFRRTHGGIPSERARPRNTRGEARTREPGVTDHRFIKDKPLSAVTRIYVHICSYREIAQQITIQT